MSRATLVVVALPLLVFAGWVAKISFDARTGDEVELAIQGFDPRDLLAGHYLRYRVDWKQPVCMDKSGEDHCVCLTDGTPAQALWSGPCGGMSACHRFIRGRCSHQGFDAGLERFYFPESWRGKLVTVPPNATIKVSVTKSGHAVVKSLHVGGRPLADWVSEAK